MKKKLFLFFILTLILIPKVLSIDINLKKEIYNSQETLQAEIIGNFVSLTEDNILIFKNDKVHSEPVIKGLTKQENKYFFYAILPPVDNESNFSLRIQNAQYIEGGKLKNDEIIKNFIVKNTNETVISINPGFVLADKVFTVKIKSIKGNKKVKLSLLGTGETKEVSLIEDSERSLNFFIPGYNNTILKIEEYEIPVFFIKKSKPEEIKFEFIPPSISGVLNSEGDYSFKIFLKNSGKKNLTDIKLSNNFNAILHPENISFLNTENYTYFKIIITKPKTNISGEVIARYDNFTITLPVYFTTTSNNTQVNIQKAGVFEEKELSCLSIGLICSQNQKCEGEIIKTFEGQCCKGNCVEIQKIEYKWILGIILIILLFLIIFYIIKKIRKNKRDKTLEEIFQEKNKEFEKRMMGEEVKKRLDKI